MGDSTPHQHQQMRLTLLRSAPLPERHIPTADSAVSSPSISQCMNSEQQSDTVGSSAVDLASAPTSGLGAAAGVVAHPDSQAANFFDVTETTGHDDVASEPSQRVKMSIHQSVHALNGRLGSNIPQALRATSGPSQVPPRAATRTAVRTPSRPTLCLWFHVDAYTPLWSSAPDDVFAVPQFLLQPPFGGMPRPAGAAAEL